MPTPFPSVDELVATIQRSLLPTVLVEGDDDVVVYRWMEPFLRDVGADFLPCGSRDKVIQVFNRRHEIARTELAFVVDQDMWIFTGKPQGFEGLIATRGYSIENDVLAGGSADRLFEPAEKAVFDKVLGVLEEWFAFEATELLAKRQCSFNESITSIIEFPACNLSANYVASRGFAPVTGSIRETIRNDAILNIRGKNVLAAYSYVLNSGARGFAYAKKAILEICIKMAEPHPHCDRLVDEIRRKLSAS